MSMIGDLIDISLERVDVVNRSHEPPTEGEKWLAVDISGQPPLDVVQQLLLVALELSARLVERAPRFVSPALQCLDLTLEPKLLGRLGANRAAFFASLIRTSRSSSDPFRPSRRSPVQRSSFSISRSNHRPFRALSSSKIGRSASERPVARSFATDASSTLPLTAPGRSNRRRH